MCHDLTCCEPCGILIHHEIHHCFMRNNHSFRATSGFKALEEARLLVHKFVDWYINTHRYSQIGFVTPAQKHRGEDIELMEQRRVLYQATKLKNPYR